LASSASVAEAEDVKGDLRLGIQLFGDVSVEEGLVDAAESLPLKRPDKATRTPRRKAGPRVSG
jgi:hypothetical protein